MISNEKLIFSNEKQWKSSNEKLFDKKQVPTKNSRAGYRLHVCLYLYTSPEIITETKKGVHLDYVKNTSVKLNLKWKMI